MTNQTRRRMSLNKPNFQNLPGSWADMLDQMYERGDQKSVDWMLAWFAAIVKEDKNDVSR